jgi:hypothetical protein
MLKTLAEYGCVVSGHSVTTATRKSCDVIA